MKQKEKVIALLGMIFCLAINIWLSGWKAFLWIPVWVGAFYLGKLGLPKRKLRIEGTKLTRAHKGCRVKYIPRHAYRNHKHSDCEVGLISSWNDTVVFVQYWNDTTKQFKSTAQGTQPENLIWYEM